jgi:perosamine synthetase
MIPHSKPLLGKAEEEASARVIRSGLVAQGAECEALERELSAYLSVGHVVVCSSGSAALHLSLLALGKRAGDRIGMPSYVCSALQNAIRHVGAEPHLVDLAPDGFNINLASMPRDCDGVIVPHMFGHAAYGVATASFPVIEDCAKAIGASYGGKKLGSIGLLGVFSFYATKVLCAGEGCAICTDDKALADLLRDLRDYDGRIDPILRFNYKMTDIQAAIARAQLQSLDTFISVRRDLANRYSDALRGYPLTLPNFAEGDIAFRYVIRHDKKEADALIKSGANRT